MFRKLKEFFFKPKKEFADLSPFEKGCVLALLNARPRDIFDAK